MKVLNQCIDLLVFFLLIYFKDIFLNDTATSILARII